MRNRRVTRRMARVTSHTLCAAGIVVMLAVMTLLNVLASTAGKRLLDSIGDKERKLIRLDEDLARESAHWEEMLSPDRLERTLIRNGIAMKYPRPDQVIRMTAEGRVIPGQIAVARARGELMPPTAKVSKKSTRRIR